MRLLRNKHELRCRKDLILVAKVFRIIFPLLCLFSSPAFAAPMIASVDQRSGLPVISSGGGVAMTSDFVFWQNNWLWAGLSTQFEVVGPYLYSILGNSPSLNFTLDGRINRPSERQLIWVFDLNARTTMSDVVGGGIAFKFDLAAFGPELGEPELLPDNRGWTWGKEGRRMEMRFDPPLASVYFEKDQKSEIRVFFYKGEVPQGLSTTSLL